jgi:ectoine hydroxylase-related dioxygenase (phytanoyl-CoA dioxygenase family)
MEYTEKPDWVPEAKRQFHEEGYFVLENAILASDLAELREQCQRQLDTHIALMERAGAEILGLSHQSRRYSISCGFEDIPSLKPFLFGDRMLELVTATLGGEAYLFLELFAVKPPRTGTPLAWHQDSGYLLGTPHSPFISLWCALDDMTESNGCLSVLPFGRAESHVVVKHDKDIKTNDLVGYSGNDPGLPLPVPAGSIIVFSSVLLHRSGVNTTSDFRRAFLACYSHEPIYQANGKLWNQAVPFLRNGARVTEQAVYDHH